MPELVEMQNQTAASLTKVIDEAKALRSPLALFTEAPQRICAFVTYVHMHICCKWKNTCIHNIHGSMTIQCSCAMCNLQICECAFTCQGCVCTTELLLILPTSCLWWSTNVGMCGFVILCASDCAHYWEWFAYVSVHTCLSLLDLVCTRSPHELLWIHLCMHALMLVLVPVHVGSGMDMRGLWASGCFQTCCLHHMFVRSVVPKE